MGSLTGDRRNHRPRERRGHEGVHPRLAPLDPGGRHGTIVAVRTSPTSRTSSRREGPLRTLVTGRVGISLVPCARGWVWTTALGVRHSRRLVSLRRAEIIIERRIVSPQGGPQLLFVFSATRVKRGERVGHLQERRDSRAP